MHNTRPFSKTHLLMLAMERADKERNRLLLLKHTYMRNTRPLSKTHSLILAMEGAEMGYFRLKIHTHTTQDHSVKTHLLMLAMKGADKERKTYYFWSNVHTYTT